jgi:hypothetical protein
VEKFSASFDMPGFDTSALCFKKWLIIISFGLQFVLYGFSVMWS